MNEITVVVKQDPGKVTWNFEEVKSYLASEMDKYTGLVYTDETIKTAKSDVAYLRSLVKQIEDRRKEVKARCLEPYEIIEKQAKELVTLVNQPIDVINRRVQEFEEQRKEQLKAEISAYWKKRIANVPEMFRAKAWGKIYDHRWLNATFSKRMWQSAIDTGIQGVEGDLETIRSFNSEFQEEMEKAYATQLFLADAIGRMNALNEQKQKILERERRRQEEQERIEKERAEMAARKAEEEPKPAQTEKTTLKPENARNEALNVQKPQESVRIPEENAQKQEEPHITLRIYGAPAILEKIKKYIVFTGSRFEEVEG